MTVVSYFNLYSSKKDKIIEKMDFFVDCVGQMLKTIYIFLR